MMDSANVWKCLLVAILLQPSFSALLSVTFDGSKYYAHEGIAKTWVAVGSFHDNTTIDG